MKVNGNSFSSYIRFSGKQYWTASLLPALLGTSLPFWLNPPGFEFNAAKALLFILLIFFAHLGFNFLYSGFTQKPNSNIKRNHLFILGSSCLLISILTGMFINSSLHFHSNVPDYIFFIYGMVSFFVGILYVIPPFSFHKRLYGEVVPGAGLGLLPVLGAYLVQVGDITRTVYLASLPIVVSTILWVWIKELIHKDDDQKSGYKTTVMFSPAKISAYYITIILIMLVYAALILSVLGRHSLNPLSLIALFSFIFALKIINTIRKDYVSRGLLIKAERYAFLIHLSICTIAILASLSSVFSIH